MKEIIRHLRHEIQAIRRARRPIRINLIKDGLQFFTEAFTQEGPTKQPSPRVERCEEGEHPGLPFDDTKDLQTSLPIVEADPPPVKGGEKPLGQQSQSKVDLVMGEKVKWQTQGSVRIWGEPNDKKGLTN